MHAVYFFIIIITNVLHGLGFVILYSTYTVYLNVTEILFFFRTVQETGQDGPEQRLREAEEVASQHQEPCVLDSSLLYVTARESG